MVIGIFNYKGGVGKTTTAVNLAALLAQERPVLFVDLDRQADPPTKWQCRYTKEIEEINGFRQQGGGVCIIDTPSRWNSLHLEAAQAMDGYIMPLNGTLRGLQACEHNETMICKAAPQARLIGVLLAACRSSNASRDVNEAAREQWGKRVFGATTRRTDKLIECMEDGGTVLSLPPATPIRQDFEALASELLRRIKIK